MSINKFCIFAAIILMCGCGPEKFNHKYHNGQCVEIKLTREQSMIVRTWLYNDWYELRVAKASKTNSAIFGPDNAENQRYALVSFREFEIQPCS